MEKSNWKEQSKLLALEEHIGPQQLERGCGRRREKEKQDPQIPLY